jgi:predicted outer membrane lipoprotein
MRSTGNIEGAMRTFIRTIIAIVAGFLLMWPLGYAYVALSLPTFHLWGLMHGTFIAAWPTLAILVFLALGYLRQFRRIDDTALLIGGLVWGLLLASAFNIRNALGYGRLRPARRHGRRRCGLVPVCPASAAPGAARDIACGFPEPGFSDLASCNA